MIVVDTAIWIELLEARGTRDHLHLRRLIERGVPIGLTDIIYCELLQGIIEEVKYRGIREVLLTYPILQVGGLRTFEHAAQIYRACRRRGFTVRNTLDCLIAAICVESGAELYQNDRDFEVIAKVQGLRLYRPSRS